MGTVTRDAEGWGSRSIPRLIRSYSRQFWPSYAIGAVFLWLTNFLAVSIPGEIGRAVDALRANEPLTRYAMAIALMGAAVIVVRTLSRVLIFNPGRHQ